MERKVDRYHNQATLCEMGKAPMTLCECGCGERDYFNRMKIVEIEAARDESRRVIWPAKRWYVKREHYQPFLLELQAQATLEQLVRYYIRQKMPWWIKIWKFRTIMRLQFVIHSRLKGIEICKRQSIRSAILFVVPNWMGKPLTRYWIWSNANNLVWRWRGTQTNARSKVSADVSEPATLGQVSG